MSRIDILIRVQVDLTEGCGGERWDVCSVVDKRTGLELGDIGIYDFDAYSDFSSDIMDAILALLKEAEEFEKGKFYSVNVEICHGGTEIGSAIHNFWA
jgi:hypothetical protein